MQKNLDVNIDNLIVSQPDTGEQALEIAEALLEAELLMLLLLTLLQHWFQKQK